MWPGGGGARETRRLPYFTALGYSETQPLSALPETRSSSGEGKETGERGAGTPGHPLGVKSLPIAAPVSSSPVIWIPRDFFPSYRVAQA